MAADSPTSTTVADLVADQLVSRGVTQCFGLIGSTNFAVTRALVARGVGFVSARHETNAVAMADAWSQTTGRLGVVSVHAGPGFANSTMALAEAAKSRTPLIVLAGAVANGAVRTNFLIDQPGLAASVDAGAERLHTRRTAAVDAARAVSRAWAERRPIVLDCPLDVQDALLEGDESSPPAEAQPAPAAPDEAALQEIATLLRDAERPLLLAGRGAVISGAGPLLRSVGERCGALLATTARAHGLFADDAWSVGVSGGFSSPGATGLIREADVIVGFGASLTSWTTRHGRLVENVRALVQVDADVARIGAYTPATHGIVADARLAAQALDETLRDTAHTGWRTPETARRISDGANNAFAPEERGDGTVDPRAFTKELDAVLPAERTVAIDGGHFMSWPLRHLSVPDERAWVFLQGFQSIGLGMGAAIGAAVARPDRLTVAALGDGGASMSLADLETVVRLGLHMVIVVYNDAAYGAEVHHFGPSADAADLELVTFPTVDFAAIARGHGADGLVVTSLEDVAGVGKWLEAHPTSGVLLVDARVTREVVADWLQEAFHGDRR